MKKRIFIGLLLLCAAVSILLGSMFFSYHPVKEVTLDGSHAVYVFNAEKMHGCENLYLSDESLNVYVTDCAGNVHLLLGDKIKSLVITKSRKIGQYALGIAKGPDGYMYIASSGHDWLTTGGPVMRVDMLFNTASPVTENIKGINGVAFDKNGMLYIAGGNMNMVFPRGKIYNMQVHPDGTHGALGVALPKAASPNGLWFDTKTAKLVVSETYSGICTFDPASKIKSCVFGKSRMVEGFDDVCIDSAGNYWVADQPDGFLKMYSPGSKRVIRYALAGFGVASSCRIRIDDGEEMLYVTEIKRSSKSKNFDGRGFVILPVKKLLEVAK